MTPKSAIVTAPLDADADSGNDELTRFAESVAKIGLTPWPEAYVLALDPGLDATGWARYRVPDGAEPITMINDYRPYLLESGVIKTKPREGPDFQTIPRRVDELIRQLPAGGTACHVVIEVPTIFGPYARKGANRGALALGMARSMASLWYVIGALTGAYKARGSILVHLPAAGEKGGHHRLVLRLWPELPTTKTGPAEDHRDAVYLGLRFLMNRKLFLAEGAL